MRYLKEPFKQWINFSGRATRKQFWLFELWYFIIFFVVAVIAAIIGSRGSSAGFVLELILVLVFIVPQISIAVRRMHDSNKSGWWLLIGFTGIGGLVLLVFYLLPSDAGANTYGAPVSNP